MNQSCLKSRHFRSWKGLQLARRLEQLGSNLIFPVVLCDERHQLGYDFAADKGILQIQNHLEENSIMHFTNRIAYEPQYPVIFKTSYSEEKFSSKDQTAKCFKGEVLMNDRVTAEEHFQETRLIRKRCKISIFCRLLVINYNLWLYL